VKTNDQENEDRTGASESRSGSQGSAGAEFHSQILHRNRDIKGEGNDGYRLYDREETLQRLSLVRQANEGYLSLREIKVQIV